MADKLNEYLGFYGRLHTARDYIREKWSNWHQRNRLNVKGTLERFFYEDSSEDTFENFPHIYRKKTRSELVRVSAAVMGIEFSYAAETAFVSPTLLKIGVTHTHMTLVWALSPLIGFFLTPILGSLSDRCHLKLGRRRPFILLMSFGVLLGLILVPNGENIGYALGDTPAKNITGIHILSAHRTTAEEGSQKLLNSTLDINFTEPQSNSHPWGIFFTILGTVLLDFDADACQSPARAYLLDVTIEEDHAKGLSTFTIMAGLGGFFGYALGGINWDATTIGLMLGGHVHAVFTLITVIFVICVLYTVTSFKEIPLYLLEVPGNLEMDPMKINEGGGVLKSEKQAIEIMDATYGSCESNSNVNIEHIGTDAPRTSIISAHPNVALSTYLKSIIFMPKSLRILCLTNLFCWMAHVCYSLYFTDFVGEAVFNGDPTALDGEERRILYEEGVRFGCWGMSMYSLSCACYSAQIEKLIRKFGAKKVYVGGLLVYSIGMFLMALTKHEISVLFLSATAGVMYSTLFTMPYLLVAHYHARETFEVTSNGEAKILGQIRGLGTDVAIISSMVFLAQFILSMCMGSIVYYSGTTTAVVCVASGLAFCGAITATQVTYLDI